MALRCSVGRCKRPAQTLVILKAHQSTHIPWACRQGRLTNNVSTFATLLAAHWSHGVPWYGDFHLSGLIPMEWLITLYRHSLSMSNATENEESSHPFHCELAEEGLLTVQAPVREEGPNAVWDASFRETSSQLQTHTTTSVENESS